MKKMKIIENPKKTVKARCVRCGTPIRNQTNKLRCESCMERVMEEFRGEISRPYQYYFRWNLRHKK